MLLTNSSLVEEIQDSVASSITGGVGVMGTGNFGGTAADDIFLIRKNFGSEQLSWIIAFDFTGATKTVNYGTVNDILFIGDFNNDGTTDLGKVSSVNGVLQFEADTNLDGTSDLSRGFGFASVDSPFGKGVLR